MAIDEGMRESRCGVLHESAVREDACARERCVGMQMASQTLYMRQRERERKKKERETERGRDREYAWGDELMKS